MAENDTYYQLDFNGSSVSPNQKKIISPLRYPGSKRRLSSYIEHALRLNNLKPELYIEPFAGGASVALNLLQKDLVDKAILIDLDPMIAGFWETVFCDTDWLIDQIMTIEVSLDNWNRFKQEEPKSIRENAIACLYLNRTSFSGIMRPEVGPLGGKEQKSDYPIDCRFPRETLVDRVIQAASHKDKVYAVWCCSWDDAMRRINNDRNKGKLPEEKSFWYLDPPFFKKAEALYRFYFEEDDHRKMRDALLKMEDSWLLSYDSAESVELLYGDAIQASTNGTKSHHIELLYSVARKRGKEPDREVILSNLDVLPIKNRLWKSINGQKGN